MNDSSHPGLKKAGPLAAAIINLCDAERNNFESFDGSPQKQSAAWAIYVGCFEMLQRLWEEMKDRARRCSPPLTFPRHDFDKRLRGWMGSLGEKRRELMRIERTERKSEDEFLSAVEQTRQAERVREIVRQIYDDSRDLLEDAYEFEKDLKAAETAAQTTKNAPKSDRGVSPYYGKTAGNGAAKRPGRKPKTKPDKTDRTVCEMLDSGDVKRYGRKWKALCVRYGDHLPKRLSADGLRKRVEREEERRGADKK